MAAFLADEVLVRAFHVMLEYGMKSYYSPTVRLFQSGPTASVNSVFGDFTEADFDGYASLPLGDWIEPAVLVSHVASAKGPALIYTAGAGITTQDLGGYYVTSNDGSDFLWFAENFASPITVDTVGQTIIVIPGYSIQDKSTV